MRAPTLATALVLASMMAACGGEREFDAPEAIEAMNSHGAALALGDRLPDGPQGAQIYAVTFTEYAPSAVGQEGPAADVHGSATILVATGTDQAEDEFDRCETAPDLTCFRASNVVLRIEGLQGADQARITTAVEAMAR